MVMLALNLFKASAAPDEGSKEKKILRRNKNMKNEKVLIIGIILGLVIFGILELLNISGTISRGTISAILVGITIGLLIDNNPIRHTFISIVISNLIAWTAIAIFDPEAEIVLGYGKAAVVGVFIGFIVIMIGLFSIIGSFSAFVTYNLRKNR